MIFRGSIIAVKELVAGKGRVGIEFDHVTLRNRAKLEAALPGVEFVDIADPCMRLRMIKSEEEQQIIRDGAAVSDIGGAAGVEAVGDGVPEYEVALHSTRAMVREIAKRYPQYRADGHLDLVPVRYQYRRRP